MILVIKKDGENLRPVSIKNNPFKRGEQIEVSDGEVHFRGIILEVEHLVELNANKSTNTLIVHVSTDASIRY